MQEIQPAKVAVIGFSLELYREKFPGYMTRLAEQLNKFCAAIAEYCRVVFDSSVLCCTCDEVGRRLQAAEASACDAVLVIPLSYCCSGAITPALLKTDLPVVIWNTQALEEITEDYDFDALLMNHVAQGTQDITSVLLREGKVFGMESGHYRDVTAIKRLGEWFDAARARQFGRRMRVGLLGQPFPGMDDFHYNPAILQKTVGGEIVPLDLRQFLQFIEAVETQEMEAVIQENKARYEIAPEVTPEIHKLSARLEVALRRFIGAYKLDAFTMNFLDLIAEPRIGTLPFTGLNKLLGEGLGYAGEGDVLRAAQMAVLRQLAGAANFTELFTADYRYNRLLMTHMQECNPALARRDRRIRLVKKDFWAPGIQPYVGMWFTLEPGPVTLTALTVTKDYQLAYICYETDIPDLPPLAKLDISHWFVQLNEPAGDFLNRYSLAGGPHHLVAVPGRQAGRLAKLAHFQGVELRQL